MTTKIEAFSVSQLAERWQVTRAKILQWIDRGELIEKNISPGMKRATFRIDPGEAARFWDSLSTRHVKHQKSAQPLKVDIGEALDFEDFI